MRKDTFSEDGSDRLRYDDVDFDDEDTPAEHTEQAEQPQHAAGEHYYGSPARRVDLDEEPRSQNAAVTHGGDVPVTGDLDNGGAARDSGAGVALYGYGRGAESSESSGDKRGEGDDAQGQAEHSEEDWSDHSLEHQRDMVVPMGGGEFDPDLEAPASPPRYRQEMQMPKMPKMPKITITITPRGVANALVHAPLRQPICFVCLIFFASIAAMAIGFVSLPLQIETSFESFLKCDVEASVMYDAYEVALGNKGDGKSRRLGEAEAGFSEADSELTRLLDAQEALIDAEAEAGNATARRATGKSAGGPLYNTKDLFVAYELKSGRSGLGFFAEDKLITLATFEKKLRALSGWQNLCGQVPEKYQVLCSPGVSFVNYAMPRTQVALNNVVPSALVLDGSGSEAVPLQTSIFLAKRQGVSSILFPSAYNLGSATASGLEQTFLLRSAFRFKVLVSSTAESRTKQRQATRKVTGQWEAFLTSEGLPLLRRSHETFHKWYSGSGLLGVEVTDALLGDVKLAAFASLFVLGYLLFHTRSIILALMGLALNMISVPLAFFLTALIAGTTKVSFAAFLALFLVVGFGSDVVFVYTDFWRDSAVHCETHEERLLWSFKHGCRASFATTATTALSFLAELASVIRALRQFGFFMGVCVLVVWGLITVIFPSLCMVDEIYFSRIRLGCRSGSKRGMEATSSEEGRVARQDAEEQSLRIRCLARWALHLQRFRFCWCACPALLALAGCIVAIFSITFKAGMPSMFPENHNQNAGAKVMDLFDKEDDSFPKTFAYPSNTEAVCDERDFNQSSCALYWCTVIENLQDAPYDFEAEQVVVAPSGPTTCTCSRRNRAPSECENTDEALFPATQRFVSPWELDSVQLKLATKAYLGSPDVGGAQGVSIEGAANTDVQVEAKPPIMLQRWVTGVVNLGYVYDTSVEMTKNSTVAGSVCGWEDLCFCGSVACEPRSNAAEQRWESIPDVFIREPDRRLAMYESTMRRRVVPKSKRGKVRVSFGLKVARTMPWLKETSDADSWRFLSTFDLRDPWAQRNLYTFCEGLNPEHADAKIAALARKLKSATTWCWMEDFREWSQRKNYRWPSLPADFDALADEYMIDGTQPTRGDRYVWREGGRVRAVYVSIEVNSAANVGAFHGLIQKATWDLYVDAWNSASVAKAQGAVHVSATWVNAEAEVALINSTVQTLAILIGLAFVGMLVFTRSLALSILVVITTVCVVFGLLFFIVCMMGWVFGLIEVIAIIYFVGYAVTYSLHVAHKYAGTAPLELEPPPPDGTVSNSNAETRLRRASYALKAIAGAAFGSAMTTAGTSAFLCFCTLTIFTKLGGMCLVVTVLSIFFALGPLPAALMICGPVNPGKCTRWRGGDYGDAHRKHKTEAE